MTDNNKFNETMLFKREDVEKNNIREILTTVYKALEDKNYKPTYLPTAALNSAIRRVVISFKVLFLLFSR